MLLPSLFRKTLSHLNLWDIAVFGIVFICCTLIFFYAVCCAPAAEWKDAVVLLFLVTGYGAVLFLTLFMPEMRRLVVWGGFLILVIAAEMVNFRLLSRFAINPVCRYAIILCFSLLLIHIGVECSWCLLRKRIFPAAFGAILQTIAEIPFIAILCRNLLAHAPVESETVSAVLQTDGREALLYAVSHRSVWGMIFLLIILFIGQFIWLLKQKNWNFPVKGYARIALPVVAAGLILTGGMICVKLYRKGKLPSFALLRAGAAYRAELAAFNKRREMMRQSKLPEEKAQQIHTMGFDGQFVLVIGESHSRDHMSCYGYREKTTPFLDRCRKDDAFTFLEGYSCHVHTTESLRMALTENNQYRMDKNGISDSVTLFDILRHSRYSTDVFSNQFPYGRYESAVTAITAGADRLIFVKSSPYARLTEETLDDRLLVYLNGEKSMRRRLTVLHLMGAHALYPLRYPVGFADDLKLPYDRAMRFTDQLLENILKISDPDVLLFIPDHGEDVALEEHDSAMFTPAMTHIPVVIYLNPRYVAYHPELAKRVKEAEKKIFTNDLTFELLLDLMGIETDFNPASLHVLSPDYDLSRDSARVMKGRRHIDGTPVD